MKKINTNIMEPFIRLFSEILKKYYLQLINVNVKYTWMTYHLVLIEVFNMRNTMFGMEHATLKYDVKLACNGLLLPVLFLSVSRNLYNQY